MSLGSIWQSLTAREPSPLRRGYVVKDSTGHTLAYNLTLQEAVALTQRDRYERTLHWHPDA